MFDYAISKRLGSSFVLNVIDDDLTARKALGFHSVDDLVEHLLFATRVPDEFDVFGHFHAVDERVPVDALHFGADVLARVLRSA